MEFSVFSNLYNFFNHGIVMYLSNAQSVILLRICCINHVSSLPESYQSRYVFWVRIYKVAIEVVRRCLVIQMRPHAQKMFGSDTNNRILDSLHLLTNIGMWSMALSFLLFCSCTFSHCRHKHRISTDNHRRICV